MKFTFGKIEKLKSKKAIDLLFSEGKSVSAFPLRLIYLKMDFNDSVYAKVGVSVSKKNFKNAANRNYLKRLLREAYRTNKHEYFNNISTQHALMILYLGKEKMEFHEIESKMTLMFEKFNSKIFQNEKRT